MRDRPTQNLLFFADIARNNPADYFAKVTAAYGQPSKSASALAADIADQVVHVSRIAVRKFWMFNLAALPLLVALIAAAVLMLLTG
jgi:hypothetical protein